MKKSGIILMAGMAVIFFSINANLKSEAEINDDYPIPADVKSVIDKSCYGCHSVNGKSDKAKKALRWDQLQEYDKKKLLSALDGIIEVVEKENMPPEKFLASKPEAKPSADEYGLLMKWAEEEAEKALN
jgi:hypothetical protein